jgi:cell volume regulation protein A
MELLEPVATAWILVTCGVLLAVSVLFSRASGRFGVPVFLTFLVLGMLAGSEGIGGLAFSDYRLAFRLGTIALALILFDGGLNTPLASVRAGIRPAGVLATVGVVGTAAIVGLGARLFGFSWPIAFLIGAVVSSTDAAAVFSTLRESGLQLKRRVGTTLELESGLNDPVAVILTTALTYHLAGERAVSWWLAVDIVIQLAVGAAVGICIGVLGRWLLQRIRLPAGGLYAVLTLGLAFLAYGLATLGSGSGFLAVYLAGVAIGNGRFPYRKGLLRVHDAAAWLCQVSMFLMLGLLVFPSQLTTVSAAGIAVSVLLVFIARPIVTMMCLFPFKYPFREIVYVSWIGLRGAIPIVLATYPVLAGVPGGQEVFNIVFFVVVFAAIIPGGTVRWTTRKLGLMSDAPPPPPAAVEIASLVPTRGDIISFYIHPASAVCGVAVRDIPFPEGSSALLVVRGEELVVPRGSTVFEAKDHVYIFCNPEDQAMMNLLFGVQEEL